MVEEGRRRVIIEGVAPEIDHGQFAIKRVVGETVMVEADIFADGHDLLAAKLLHRHKTEDAWKETEMEPMVNDRWRGSFPVTALGNYFYTIEAWMDHFKSWKRDLAKKVEAGQEVAVDLLIGAALVEAAAERAGHEDRSLLQEMAAALRSEMPLESRVRKALSEELLVVMSRYPDRRYASRYAPELRVVVDPVLARFSSWYEMFPRSASREAGRHGTFQDCEALLPRVARMGFDVLYLPPVHPIGRSFRKGRNNNPVSEPGEPGSPWGIGGEEGGHKAIHPELGTMEEFRRLAQKAGEYGISLALDIAFQCSPDHPWVKKHPDWFLRRPDGAIQYAENPPKKYQDIYPLNFESPDWRNLWVELKSVFEFWVEQGVKVFRVDNPHTKALPFWEWAIQGLKENNPELIFLSEAFTRPKVMYYLAKAGFTQSYNYFPWRNSKHELTEYFTELTQTPVREFFRPNLWPNTPDILTQYLQYGGPPAFRARLILAATLGASYGIYGPAFELCENLPREMGSEEYLNSEKYEIRHWNLDQEGNLSELIAQLNAIRRQNPALHSNDQLVFHRTDNEQVLAYSKHTPALDNLILVIVNLDPHHTHSAWIELDMESWGLDPAQSYQVHDLVTEARYLWNGPKNFVILNPAFVPAHVFRVRRRIRSEQDFDYYM